MFSQKDIADACRAEELCTLDELEEAAARYREKLRERAQAAIDARKASRQEEPNV